VITIRKSNDRGHANHGWLDTRHTFSFGGYHDPEHMNYRSLRVINQDVVAPGRGFGRHAHRDMEIISYLVDGTLQHQDSMGHTEDMRAGDVQVMTAGTGVMHSEQNPSTDEPVHFLQIWIEPRERGLTPSYAQRRFDVSERRDRLRLLASPDGLDGSLPIHQEAEVYATLLSEGHALAHRLRQGCHAWVQVVRGAVEVGGQRLEAGDGAAIDNVDSVSLRALEDTEFLLFDLA
jgi:redox-sensitive bicupin YhaK (pirin superfamily)